MVNTSIFNSRSVKPTDTRNNAGGNAYQFSDKHALAQYAMTGCFNSTFYQSADLQVDKLLNLCDLVSPEFVAKTAIFARERGYMKDTPAFLCAYLAKHAPDLLEPVFDRVIDNGKMLRNFVQIIRSGVTGRRSLGSRPKRLVCKWLEKKSHNAVFRASVGSKPSMADVVKMVHPKAGDPEREALYGYLIGREVDPKRLPRIVREFEAFKRNRGAVPDVPFQMLTSLNLGRKEWTAIARNASWQMTRMNLNTFARHGVFEVDGMTQLIADRLRNAEAVVKARVFPYQLMCAYKNISLEVPYAIQDALQDAMEVAVANVPEIDGQIYVLPDTSGSMTWNVTGARPGASSKVRCVDVAALVSAAILRKNPNTVVLPFDTDVVTNIRLNPRDSVVTNAQRLARSGGGTNCSAPLAYMNDRKMKGDLVIYVSDNESWIDTKNRWNGTATLNQWQRFKKRNPQAKLVCLDIVPGDHTQACEQADILNVGGFSDQVFDLIASFARGETTNWVGKINQTVL